MGKLGKTYPCSDTLHHRSWCTVLHRGLPDVLSRRQVLDLVALSAMAARGLRHTAVSMNELNSHCSDAVITMDTVHPVVSRTPCLASLASYRLDLPASRALSFSPPFLVHTVPFLSLSLGSVTLAHLFADSVFFPRFWPRYILYSARWTVKLPV